MIITVASGKGGTGKTLVTASLAHVWGGPLTAVDLDVEEPNLHLFLRPELVDALPALMEVPVVDEDACTGCRACSDLCQFKAITVFGDVAMTFPEMCHGCGGCLAVCPVEALSPGSRELGEITTGTFGAQRFAMGRLRVGEAMSPPLMRQVKALVARWAKTEGRDTLVDGPPGVSCPAVTAVGGSDVVVLVADSTPFGMHDFQLALEAFAPMHIPTGVVVNNVGLGDNSCQALCRERGLPVWAEIPFSRTIAEHYSRGDVVAEAMPEFRPVFERLRDSILEAAHA
ncbi:MAG: 4Fe-4S binding protein [Desulfovibrionaceae bacterium]